MKKCVWVALVGWIAVAGLTFAEDIDVTENIVVSTTWTADNVYHLKALIFVEPGASLTIEPGTVIRGNTDSALIVARGAQIFANGRQSDPIIMTSEEDDLVTWRPSCEEWGNLTIMGNALIAKNDDASNPHSGQPDGMATAQMEGLAARFEGDTLPRFGGDDDDDDSGVVRYVSLRYGGKVLSLANELNGISLGGVGRGTDMEYVEIMNNVDDGIEIWGGTLNIKHVAIFNIGDDSFDLDQGYRGKAQFGLIVQGYCGTSSQGSGIGDNCFEMDGAEDATAQPYGTVAIYNFTAIGQPFDGDQGTEWRDNMRGQFHNCIFMNVGGRMIRDGGTGGDGGGYGSPGVPTLASLWNTPYDTYPENTVGVDPAALYPVLTSGFMCQMTHCVFYDNTNGNASLDDFGVLEAANYNVIAVDSPIQGLEREDPVQVGGKIMANVTRLDPLAANDAVTSDLTAPDDGVFTPVAYKGAFKDYNWLHGWSAAHAFGLVD